MGNRRTIEVTIISAKDLMSLNAGLLGRRMQTYAVAWIDPQEKHFTNLNSLGGIHPKWNRRIYWSVDEEALLQAGVLLNVEIYNHNQAALFNKRDTILGTVQIPLNDFAQLLLPCDRGHRDGVTETQYRCYQIRRPSGELKGFLNVGVRMGMGGLLNNCKSFDASDEQHSLLSSPTPLDN